jgi:hypothetical protein
MHDEKVITAEQFIGDPTSIKLFRGVANPAPRTPI